MAELADTIDQGTAELGIPREDRPYSPHLTLARARGGSGSPKWRKDDKPNTVFRMLEERLAAMGDLDFGTMMAREFVLYQSKLAPAGSKYSTLQRLPLLA
jgi:2'-5' RNA ligase